MGVCSKRSNREQIPNTIIKSSYYQYLQSTKRGAFWVHGSRFLNRFNTELFLEGKPSIVGLYTENSSMQDKQKKHFLKLF